MLTYVRQERLIEHATASTCMQIEPVSHFWGRPFGLGDGYGDGGGR